MNTLQYCQGYEKRKDGGLKGDNPSRAGVIEEYSAAFGVLHII